MTYKAIHVCVKLTLKYRLNGEVFSVQVDSEEHEATVITIAEEHGIGIVVIGHRRQLSGIGNDATLDLTAISCEEDDILANRYRQVCKK